MLSLDWQDDVCRFAVEQAKDTEELLDDMDRDLDRLRDRREL